MKSASRKRCLGEKIRTESWMAGAVSAAQPWGQIWYCGTNWQIIDLWCSSKKAKSKFMRHWANQDPKGTPGMRTLLRLHKAAAM